MADRDGVTPLSTPTFRIEDSPQLLELSNRIGARLGAAVAAAGFHIASAVIMNRDISGLVQNELLLEVRPRGLAMTADIIRQCEAIEISMCKAAVNLGFEKLEFQEMCEELFKVILIKAALDEASGRPN